MDKQEIEEKLLRHLQDVQHVLDVIREDGRLSISDDHAKRTVESLK